MPVNDDRRTEIRIPMPVQFWFNILKSKREYMRIESPASTFLESIEAGQELEGRDETEQFLLRLDTKLDYLISLLTDNISRKDYEFKGLVIDISESGLRFISPEDLPEGAILEAGLRLPHQPHRTMDFAGEIIWGGDQTISQGDPRDVMGLRFIDILPSDQDEIVHYIFQKQRVEIRRRKDIE